MYNAQMSVGQSIALIGMAGVGKSTFGRKLALKKDLLFIDTDDLLQEKIGTTLQRFLKAHGSKELLKKEEAIILSLKLTHQTIIATGGSVVYSEEAMLHLKKIAKIAWLNDTFENIKKRIPNSESRGLINPNQLPLDLLFEERNPLYKRYADTIINFPEETNKNSILKKLEALL